MSIKSGSLWVRVVASSLLTCASCGGHLPADDEFITSFKHQKNSYDQLVGMIIDDQLRFLELNDGVTAPTVAIVESSAAELSEARIDEYRSLLRSLGVSACYNPYKGEFITFVAAESGWPTCRTQMIYLYSEASPSNRDSDIQITDRIDRMPIGDDVARSIGEEWYLYRRPCRD